MTEAAFVWRFFDLGESRLALTAPFRRRALVRPAAELARAFHALAPEPPYGEGAVQPPPGGLALFEDACCLGGALIAASGALVAESLVAESLVAAPRRGALRQESDGAASVRIWPLTSMRRLAGDYIFLRQPGDGDYARWLIDLLPRVVVAAQFCDLSAFRFVVARSTSQRMQVVRDSLGLFWVRPERIVAIGDAPTFFQRLVFPLPAAKYPCGKSPRAIEALEYLPARFPDASDAPRRLYVKTGEDESLLDLLKPLGFVAVEPARMSFAERARAFRKAEWIAGAAGAGLANAALAPRGLRLLAVTARDDEEAFYRDLAEVKQGRFLSLRPDADAAAVTALLDDFLA